MPADAELSAVLSRRQQINDTLDEGKEVKKEYKFINPYVEFPELSRKQIKEYEKMFKANNTSKSGFIDLPELKLFMEKLGAPQTHLALKEMIREVDEDGDGKISFREAAAGELSENSGLGKLARLTEIDVDQVGVGGAKDFFEAKIKKISLTSKFEEEIKQEQEEKKQEAQKKKESREKFKEKAKLFEA